MDKGVPYDGLVAKRGSENGVLLDNFVKDGHV